MTLYYFHLCDGVDVLLDPDGRDLDSTMVENAALTEARALIAADVRSGHISLDQRIEVHDGREIVIYRLPFDEAVTVTPRAVSES